MARLQNKSDLAREVWRCLFDFIIDTAMHRNRVLGTRGLSPNDARALFALDAREGRTMGSLAEEWGTDASYVTSLVDRLEHKRLAKRSARPGDRRVRLVTLAPAGVTLKKRLAHDLYVPPDQLLALSRTDLEALLAGVTRLEEGRVLAAASRR